MEDANSNSSDLCADFRLLRVTNDQTLKGFQKDLKRIFCSKSLTSPHTSDQHVEVKLKGKENFAISAEEVQHLLE